VSPGFTGEKGGVINWLSRNAATGLRQPPPLVSAEEDEDEEAIMIEESSFGEGEEEPISPRMSDMLGVSGERVRKALLSEEDEVDEVAMVVDISVVVVIEVV